MRGVDARIILDRNPLVYTTGDVVAGHISCEFDQPLPNCEIDVTFLGRIETFLSRTKNASSAYRELFQVKQTLHKGPIEANRLGIWSFSFPIPHTVAAIDKVSAEPIGAEERDRHQPQEHSLPPTVNAYDMAFSGPYGRVVYTVIASATDPKRMGRHESPRVTLLRRHITYVPTWNLDSSLRQQPTIHTHSTAFVRESHRLLPDSQDKSSLRARSKSFFQSRDLPSWRFRIITEAPDRAVPGTDIAVSLYLDDSVENSPDLRAPQVILKSFSAQLLAWTQIQFERKGAPSNKAKRVHSEASASTTSYAGPLARGSDHAKTIEWKLSPGIPPDFETSYLLRTHMLKLKFCVECLGKTFEQEQYYAIKIDPRPDKLWTIADEELDQVSLSSGGYEHSSPSESR
jgi:hypothetical protein